MKKISKIIWIELFIIIVSLLIYSIHPFLNPKMNLFIYNLGIIWYVFFLFFLLIFGTVYTVKKEDPRVLFFNIILFVIYFVSPFIISKYLFVHA